MKHDEDELLDGDDATLMLYVAGELSPADAQAFQARLAADTTMKARTTLFGDVDSVLRSHVGATSLASLDSRRALGSSLRLVREQALVLQGRSAMRIRRPRLASVPRWGWATAAAACLAVGFVFWANNSDPIAYNPTKPNTNVAIDENGQPMPEFRGLSSAFAAIPLDGSEDATGEIDNQLDALNVLATMNELN